MPPAAKRRNRKQKDKETRPRALYSDFGTPERSRHGPVAIETVPADEESSRNRDRARAIEIDDPLYVYRRNRVITVLQRDAGLILRELWNRTGREPRVVAPYSDFVAHGSIEGMRITSEDHHQRFVEALRAVGPIGSDTIVSVVCLQDFIPRGHFEILRRGLDILSKKFGLQNE